jgi:hypothetical protein
MLCHGFAFHFSLAVFGVLVLGIRFCVYPQELGFEIDADGALLTQIQVLSHQFKIAKRIEIYVGFGPDYLHAEFKRLGYVLCALTPASWLFTRVYHAIQIYVA